MGGERNKKASPRARERVLAKPWDVFFFAAPVMARHDPSGNLCPPSVRPYPSTSPLRPGCDSCRFIEGWHSVACDLSTFFFAFSFVCVCVCVCVCVFIHSIPWRWYRVFTGFFGGGSTGSAGPSGRSSWNSNSTAPTFLVRLPYAFRFFGLFRPLRVDALSLSLSIDRISIRLDPHSNGSRRRRLQKSRSGRGFSLMLYRVLP